MKNKDVMVKGIYWMKVSGNLVKVLILRVDYRKGWWGRNLSTGREVRILTGARCRSRADVDPT